MEPMENTQPAPGRTHRLLMRVESTRRSRMTQKAADMVKITREQEGIRSHPWPRASRSAAAVAAASSTPSTSRKEPREEIDWVYDQGGINVFVDAVSARYLEGTNIDYVLGSTGAGFKFQQPQGARHLRLLARRSRSSR